MNSKLNLYLEEVKDSLIHSVVCFLVKDNQVLLGKRTKVSNGLGLDLYQGIGGKLEVGETYEDALLRELDEEIQVKLIKYESKGFVTFLFPHKPNWSQKVEIFICTKWEKEPETTDVITPVWTEKDKLPLDYMWKDNAIWVPKILNGENIDAVFLEGEDGEVVEYLFRD